eukprot:1195322-Prorocentrum_minimum.AAC.2
MRASDQKGTVLLVPGGAAGGVAEAVPRGCAHEWGRAASHGRGRRGMKGVAEAVPRGCAHEWGRAASHGSGMKREVVSSFQTAFA